MKHRKKKTIIPIALRVVICAAFAFLFLLIFSSAGALPFGGEESTVEVCGEKFPASSEAIVFNGDEVGSVDEVLSKLGDFKHLGYVDLGSYSVDLGEVGRIREASGDVRVNCRTHVTMYGVDVDTEAYEVYLGGVGMSSSADLAKWLPSLPNVTKVMSEDSTIPLEEKYMLIESFPDVEFKLSAIVRVCGVDASDTSVDLDLKACAPDAELLDKLKLFPALKAVDLRGTKIDPQLQTQLLDAYPDVRFLWDVAIGEELFDSSTQDLDLSGKRGIDLDAVKSAIPLFCDLKRIDLSDCGFANETLAEMREEFPGIKIVWRLYMGKWSLKTDAVAFSVLIYAYNYKRLTSADIEVLKYCTDLQALDLGHQALTDLSVIGDYLPELRILILADNTVSDLTPIAKLKHLHYLELFVNPYLSDLTPIGACKEMVDLNISHLYTVSDISMLLDFPQLERLWIEHTAVSDADIQLLRSTYPDARVVNIGYGSVDQGWRSHDRYFAMIDMYFDTTYISEEFSKYDGKD